MIIWVIAGLLGLATGLRIGWALVNKQSLVSTAMILAVQPAHPDLVVADHVVINEVYDGGGNSDVT